MDYIQIWCGTGRYMFKTSVRRVLIVSTLLIFSGLFLLCAGDGNNISDPKPVMVPLNPDYLAYQNQSKIEEAGYPTGFVPPQHRISDPTDRYTDLSLSELLPSSYDLRSQNRVTSVKDQSPWNTCWAFSALSSLESNLMPYENLNFSEKNVINRNYKGTTPDSGGNYYNAGGYFAAQLGPLSEQNDPYPVGTWNYSSPTSPVEKNIYEIHWLPDKNSSSDLETIKKTVMNYGALSTTYYNIGEWNSTYNSYYYPTKTMTNHEVAIAGWDDNFSKYNFTSPPLGDGAFLIKNSWGADWGDKGYGWISYYDANIGLHNTMFVGSNTSRFNEIYQHDLAGPTTSVGFGADNWDIWGASRFTAVNSSYLNAVGFYTTDNPTAYQLKIYKNPTTGPIGGEEVYAAEGTFDIAGYHGVELATPVKIEVNDLFSIVIHLINDDYAYPLPIQYPSDLQDYDPAIYYGDSYYSGDGVGWSDLTTLNDDNSTACIKGYMRYSLSNPVVTGITPSSGQAGTTVSCTVSGHNFATGATVNLTRTGQPNITSTGTVSGSGLTVPFSLPSGSLYGQWNVSVNQDDLYSNDNVQFTITPAPVAPVVQTLGNGTVTSNTAVLIGNVTSIGSGGCTVWFGYSTSPAGSLTNTSYINQSSVGQYNATVTGLNPNTTYYYTAFASNSGGTVNGTIQSFKTSNQPENTYYINATTCLGGTITPSGMVPVLNGQNQSFSITALPCYTITDVEVNGQNLGPQISPYQYTFTNVTANQTIGMQCTQIQYQITASAGTGGSITPSGVITVPLWC